MILRRIFLVKSSTAFTAPKFNLRCIAGSSGRLDVICRCILNAFFIDESNFRRNVVFYGVLEGPPDPPKTLCIDGFEVEHMVLDEVWIANMILDLFSGKIFKGFKISKMSFRSVVEFLRNSGVNIVYMHEDGIPIENYSFKSNFDYCFIIGDQIGLDHHSEKFLDSIGVIRISLGKIPYLSSQCIWLINAFLDGLNLND